jgi:hypothetical protein
MKASITPAIHEFFGSLGCSQLSNSVPDYWHSGIHIALLYADEYTSELESISFPPHAMVIVMGTQVTAAEDILLFHNLAHESIRITDLAAFIANRAFGEEHIEWRETVNALQTAEGTHEEAEITLGDAQTEFDDAKQQLEFAQDAWSYNLKPRRFRPVVIS